MTTLTTELMTSPRPRAMITPLTSSRTTRLHLLLALLALASGTAYGAAVAGVVVTVTLLRHGARHHLRGQGWVNDGCRVPTFRAVVR